MAKKSDTRTLEIKTLDELVAEARRLLDEGYRSGGNWTLGQACGHVSDWLRFPMDGYPKMGIFMKVVMKTMQVDVGGDVWLRNSLLVSRFQRGSPTMPDTVPAADGLADTEGGYTFRRSRNSISWLPRTMGGVSVVWRMGQSGTRKNPCDARRSSFELFASQFVEPCLASFRVQPLSCNPCRVSPQTSRLQNLSVSGILSVSGMLCRAYKGIGQRLMPCISPEESPRAAVRDSPKTSGNGAPACSFSGRARGRHRSSLKKTTPRVTPH